MIGRTIIVTTTQVTMYGISKSLVFVSFLADEFTELGLKFKTFDTSSSSLISVKITLHVNVLPSNFVARVKFNCNVWLRGCEYVVA